MVRTKFIHIADLHLGKKQYNNEERYKDYFRAFQEVLNLALRENVDFILIAGDMFDNRKLNPNIITRLYYMITTFKKKSVEQLNHPIDIICIEGNHDANLFSKQSWMTFLANLDLIILLSGKHNKSENTVVFEPYNHEAHRGGMYQVKNVRIYGFPYFGSSLTRLFQPFYDTIEKDEQIGNVLMLHFGINGQIPSRSGIDISEDLLKLHEKIDYLALGHFHKKYKGPEEQWIHNPGSLEITDIKEIIEEYERCVYLVETLETGSKVEFRHREIRCTPNAEEGEILNRSFQHWGNVSIEGSTSFKETIEIVLSFIEDRSYPLRDSDLAYDPSDLRCPVLSLNLKGNISYSRLDVNIHQIRELIMEKFSLLEVRIYNRFLKSTLDDIIDIKEAKTFQEIETDVFQALVNTNPEYESKSNEIVLLMKTLQSAMMVKKPDHVALKDLIKEWALEHADMFKTPIIITRPDEDLIEEESFIDEEEDEDEEDDFDYESHILDSKEDD